MPSWRTSGSLSIRGLAHVAHIGPAAEVAWQTSESSRVSACALQIWPRRHASVTCPRAHPGHSVAAQRVAVHCVDPRRVGLGEERPCSRDRPTGQKGNLVAYAVTEVPAHERSDIITAYRKKAGREVNGYWKKLPEDTDHPTFMLTP